MLKRPMIGVALLGASGLSIASASATGSWRPDRHADTGHMVLAQTPSFGPSPNNLKFKGGGASQGPYVGLLKPPQGGYQFKGGGADTRTAGRLCRPSSRRAFFENCWWLVQRVCLGQHGPARESFACMSCPDLPGRRCPGAPSRPWDRR